MTSVLVAYLQPNGDRYAAAAERFFDSYRDYRAGAEHDMMLVVKDDAPLVWNTTKPIVIEDHPNEGQDIGSLQRVCKEHADYDWVCWLGAWSRCVTDDWLAKLLGATNGPNVGAVAAAGSFAPGVSREWPNPHLRTNCLLIPPVLLNGLGFGEVIDRGQCMSFEHGTDSLYRRLRGKHLRGLVVGADGVAYEEHYWSRSNTCCFGDQSNLLMADRGSDAYHIAGPAEREALSVAP